LAFGREVSGFSPSAVQGIRECIAAAGPQVTDAGLAMEDHHVRAEFGSYNALEGVAAFLEKRAPKFIRS
jgi:enoyl-CoA hydratase/carnithine racemase